MKNDIIKIKHQPVFTSEIKVLNKALQEASDSIDLFNTGTSYVGCTASKALDLLKDKQSMLKEKNYMINKIDDIDDENHQNFTSWNEFNNDEITLIINVSSHCNDRNIFTKTFKTSSSLYYLQMP